MKNKKRILACLLALAMIGSLAACTPSDSDVDSTTTTTTTTTGATDPGDDSTTASTDFGTDVSDTTTSDTYGDSTDSTDNWYNDDWYNDDNSSDNTTVADDDNDGTTVHTPATKATTTTTTKNTTASATTTAPTTTTTTKPTYTGPDYVVTIDSSKVVNDYYEGIGGNVVPMNLVSGQNGGFSDAYWEAEYSRILKLSTPVVRMWVQVDWFEKEKGVFNLDTPQMKAVMTYLDAFKKSGTNVQITYNWKVGEEIQDWFSIPGITSAFESAPNDLDAFAVSCAELLEQLWARGYDNVKYLTFANEPNIGDFECYGDQLQYYIEMVKKVDAELEKRNIRDKVGLWGCESSEGLEWYARCATYPELFDAISWHSYAILSDQLDEYMDPIPRRGVNRYYLSETSERSDKTHFESGLAGLAINGANQGLTALLNWCMNGVGSMSTDENSRGWCMYTNRDFWNSFNMDQGALNAGYENGHVNNSYYVASMFGNYVPTGSKVVSSTVNSAGMRSATFLTPDGDYTVAVEYDESTQDRNITINFDKAINKTFYKYVYTDDIVCDQNALVPASVGTFDVKKQLKDSAVAKGYSVVLYSTKAPITQVKIDKCYVELKAGESVDLSASIVDGNGEIEWSIVKATNCTVDKGHTALNRTGTLTVNGSKATYKAAADAVGTSAADNSQDVIALKAQVKGTNAYTIAIVKIVTSA